MTSDTVGAQYLYDKGDDLIEIWLLPHRTAQAFTSDSVIPLNDDFSVVSVRPAMSKEVSLMVLGVPINVKDTVISDYVTEFGGQILSPPDMCTTKSGLWKGKVNGDRRYKANFSNQLMAMGTYHLIAGKKVRFVYPGNLRTCARCHQPAESCPGKGFATACKASKGTQVLLSSHLDNLKAELKAIRDRKNNEQLPPQVDDHAPVVPQQVAHHPQPSSVQDATSFLPLPATSTSPQSQPAVFPPKSPDQPEATSSFPPENCGQSEATSPSPSTSSQSSTPVHNITVNIKEDTNILPTADTKDIKVDSNDNDTDDDKTEEAGDPNDFEESSKQKKKRRQRERRALRKADESILSSTASPTPTGKPNSTSAALTPTLSQDWELQIVGVLSYDSGQYHCQATIHPPSFISLTLSVVGK